MNRYFWRCSGVVLAVLASLVGSAPAAAHFFGAAWGPAVAETDINSGSTEGCPIETPDGRSLLFASNRPNGVGGLDIWAADRTDVSSPWQEPRNVGAPVNSDAGDFCPTPVYGRWLLFVSERSTPDSCGGGDIYLSRQSPADGWSEPEILGCAPNGPNSSGPERSPSVVSTWYGTFLFYSSNGGSGDNDVYVSRMGPDGRFGAGHVVESLSSDYEDFMPNVRVASNGMAEVVFNSNRPSWGRNDTPAEGGQDVYTAYAWNVAGRWSSPVNLGPNVNTPGNETRASLSGDGKRLHFGRDGDIYVSERP
jgi:WD40-like Beta Propeller Repeat